jgi:hypothetical protein
MRTMLPKLALGLLSLGTLSACGDVQEPGSIGMPGAGNAASGGTSAGTAPVGLGGSNVTAGGSPTGGNAVGGQATSGAGGQSTAGMPGGLAGAGPTDYPLNCGTEGIVIEGHGPPANRVNYVIVGDGYNQADIDGGLYLEHIMLMINGNDEPPSSRNHAEGRFGPEMEPYRTYRNFVNICALKVVSVDSGIVEGTDSGGCPGPPNTAFDGCGDDTSRLGHINRQKVDAAVGELAPPDMEVDWVGVMMNDAEWWNSGSNPMVWSGGHTVAGLAAMHEGGHGFQELSDEYGGCGGNRINVTSNMSTTEDKWTHWLGFNQDPGTGMQTVRQCDGSKWAPTEDSVMNDLWASSYFNSISLENAVRIIYEMVKPIDSHTELTVTTPQVLEVKVVDPAVIGVDWSVDGTVVAPNGGATFDVAAKGLAPGSHKITARAHDDTPWVPMDTPHGREDLEQTVEWTITVP